jgi:hypothetical protein
MLRDCSLGSDWLDFVDAFEMRYEKRTTTATVFDATTIVELLRETRTNSFNAEGIEGEHSQMRNLLALKKEKRRERIVKKDANH